jgi:hypothetical protein
MVAREQQQNWGWQQLASSRWLLTAIAIFSLIVATGLLQGCSGENLTAEAPEQAPREMAQAPADESNSGLVQAFTVENPGTELPPQTAEVALPGESIPDLGREHVPETERVTYNSDPPTSGSHHEQWAQWGIYDQAPVDEQLVHNLEHGGVIVSYNPAQLSAEDLQQLRSQVSALSEINPRLILTPRETLDSAIALTAWGYLQKLESYDPDAVETFYNAHIARGPECQQGLCPN